METKIESLKINEWIGLQRELREKAVEIGEILNHNKQMKFDLPDEALDNPMVEGLKYLAGICNDAIDQINNEDADTNFDNIGLDN